MARCDPGTEFTTTVRGMLMEMPLWAPLKAKYLSVFEADDTWVWGSSAPIEAWERVYPNEPVFQVPRLLAVGDHVYCYYDGDPDNLPWIEKIRVVDVVTYAGGTKVQWVVEDSYDLDNELDDTAGGVRKVIEPSVEEKEALALGGIVMPEEPMDAKVMYKMYDEIAKAMGVPKDFLEGKPPRGYKYLSTNLRDEDAPAPKSEPQPVTLPKTRKIDSE